MPTGYGLKSYSGAYTSNRAQLEMIRQVTQPLKETDAGKTAAQMYGAYQTVSAFAKDAYYRNAMNSFLDTTGYQTEHLSAAMNSAGVEGFTNIYAHNSEPELKDFKENITNDKGYTDIKFDLSKGMNNVYKTGQIEFTATDASGKKIHDSYDINKIQINTNIAVGQDGLIGTRQVVGTEFADMYKNSTEADFIKLLDGSDKTLKLSSGLTTKDFDIVSTNKSTGLMEVRLAGSTKTFTTNLSQLEVNTKSTVKSVSGKEYLQSFAKTHQERTLNLIRNGNIVNSFLQTDATFKDFHIDRMSAAQLEKEIKLLEGSGTRASSAFSSKAAEILGTDKIDQLKEVAKVKRATELAEKYKQSGSRSKSMKKRSTRRSINKSSNGEDAIAGFNKMAMGASVMRQAIKVPTAANRTYHTLQKKSLDIARTSSNPRIAKLNNDKYNRLYGTSGRITKRQERLDKIKDKTNIKGKIKTKAKDKWKESRLNGKISKIRNKLPSRYTVRTPKPTKFSKLKDKLREKFLNPIKEAGKALVNAILKTKIVTVIISILSSIIALLSQVATFVMQAMLAILGFALLTTLPFVLISAIIGGAVSIVGAIADSFKEDSTTVLECSKLGVNTALEEEGLQEYFEDEDDPYAYDDYVDDIMKILSERSGLDVSFCDEDNDKYGIGALSSDEYSAMVDWAEEQGESLEPNDDEMDDNGNVTQAYVQRAADLQTRYLYESGLLDKWIYEYRAQQNGG